MTNEQTIEAIMDAVQKSQDSAFRRGDGLEGYEESVAADQYVRDLITSALGAKDHVKAALKADAERYRWLRDHAYMEFPCDSPKIDGITYQHVDAAIDAAMKAGA